MSYWHLLALTRTQHISRYRLKRVCALTPSCSACRVVTFISPRILLGLRSLPSVVPVLVEIKKFLLRASHAVASVLAQLVRSLTMFLALLVRYLHKVFWRSIAHVLVLSGLVLVSCFCCYLYYPIFSHFSQK